MRRTCSSSASGRSRPTPGARAGSTGPQDVYAIDPLVRLSLDALVGARYAPAPGAFDWVRAGAARPAGPVARGGRPRLVPPPAGRGARRVRRPAGLHREGDPDPRARAEVLGRPPGARAVKAALLLLVVLLPVGPLRARAWATAPRASARSARRRARRPPAKVYTDKDLPEPTAPADASQPGEATSSLAPRGQPVTRGLRSVPRATADLVARPGRSSCRVAAPVDPTRRSARSASSSRPSGASASRTRASSSRSPRPTPGRRSSAPSSTRASRCR